MLSSYIDKRKVRKARKALLNQGDGLLAFITFMPGYFWVAFYKLPFYYKRSSDIWIDGAQTSVIFSLVFTAALLAFIYRSYLEFLAGGLLKKIVVIVNSIILLSMVIFSIVDEMVFSVILGIIFVLFYLIQHVDKKEKT